MTTLRATSNSDVKALASREERYMMAKSLYKKEIKNVIKNARRKYARALIGISDVRVTKL